jgi:hypothetical protein
VLERRREMFEKITIQMAEKEERDKVGAVA